MQYTLANADTVMCANEGQRISGNLSNSKRTGESSRTKCVQGEQKILIVLTLLEIGRK